MDEFEVFVGIDWSTTFHDVCIVGSNGKVLARGRFPDNGEGDSQLSTWLTTTTKSLPGKIAVGIELTRGHIVETLIERGFSVFAINPKQLDRFRDRFSVAGAKDDSLDAEVIGTSLRTDFARYRRVALDEPAIVELREWSRAHEDVQHELVRVRNQMLDLLRRYYPAFIDLYDDICAPVMLELWELIPSSSVARGMSPRSVTAILKRNRIRVLDADAVLASLRATPVHLAPGTSDAIVARMRLMVPRARLLVQQVREAHRKLESLGKALSESAPVDGDAEGQKCEHRDAAILLSLPGIAWINLATVLAEAGHALKQRDYHALRLYAGAAPVTKRSGNVVLHHMRIACNDRLRNAVHSWATTAATYDPWSKSYYDALRGRGHSHGRAARQLGDRLLSVACSMLRSGQLFDPTRRHAHSPVDSLVASPRSAGRVRAAKRRAKRGQPLTRLSAAS